MSWLRTYIVSCAAVTAFVFMALVLLVFFADLGLSGHGIAAMFLGALLTVAVAVALMGLVFSSSRSGRDERVRGESIGKTAGPGSDCAMR